MSKVNLYPIAPLVLLTRLKKVLAIQGQLVLLDAGTVKEGRVLSLQRAEEEGRGRGAKRGEGGDQRLPFKGQRGELLSPLLQGRMPGVHEGICILPHSSSSHYSAGVKSRLLKSLGLTQQAGREQAFSDSY